MCTQTHTQNQHSNKLFQNRIADIKQMIEDTGKQYISDTGKLRNEDSTRRKIRVNEHS